MSPRSYAQHNSHHASDFLRPVAGWDIYNAYAVHQNSPVKRIDQTLHTRCDLVTTRLHGDTVLEVINPWGFQDLLRLTQHVQAREDKAWRQTLILRDEARVELTALISDASPGTLRFELERDCVLKLSSDYLAASLAHPMHMKVDSAGSAMLIFETAGINLNRKATPILHGLSCWRSYPGDRGYQGRLRRRRTDFS
ncbi:hypothetical protein [Bordetella sp. 15P40C-2]|uniref:hypothetical protein n=1 Tax=Bordetella sp. 15P40C-2 TaxID=2572246 RepID=UPI00132B771E|nr:hypothetical protein [Bordetella sp. 15P40C-2]MVW70701.1 hypothetical protein [Bordetella sp. 15P40C-2]